MPHLFRNPLFILCAVIAVAGLVGSFGYARERTVSCVPSDVFDLQFCSQDLRFEEISPHSGKITLNAFQVDVFRQGTNFDSVQELVDDMDRRQPVSSILLHSDPINKIIVRIEESQESQEKLRAYAVGRSQVYTFSTSPAHEKELIALLQSMRVK